MNAGNLNALFRTRKIGVSNRIRVDVAMKLNYLNPKKIHDATAIFEGTEIRDEIRQLIAIEYTQRQSSH